MVKVSVVLPVYNCENFIRQSMDSILEQTFQNFEILVMNDGSTDRSKEIVCSYHDSRIRFIDGQINKGLTVVLNQGLKLAEGEFVARQDGDDFSIPHRLEVQVDYLEKHPEVVLLGSQAWVVDKDNRFKGVILDKPIGMLGIRWDLLFDNSFLHSTVMFRRQAILEKLNGYDENYSFCEDYELWSRVAKENNVQNLPQRLIKYRRHPDSHSQSSPQKTIEENKKVIRRNIMGFMGSVVASDSDIDLIIRYRFGMPFDRISMSGLLRVLKGLESQYLESFPHARISQEFQVTVARQYLKILWKIKTWNPLLWGKVLANGLQYPVLKVGLLLVFELMKGKLLHSLGKL